MNDEVKTESDIKRAESSGPPAKFNDKTDLTNGELSH